MSELLFMVGLWFAGDTVGWWDAMDWSGAGGLSEDEACAVIALGCWALAFVAWVVERFTAGES